MVICRYRRVSARWGLQQTTRAPDSNKIRGLSISILVIATYKNLKKKRTDCTFDLFLLRQGEPGISQYNNIFKASDLWFFLMDHRFETEYGIPFSEHDTHARSYDECHTKIDLFEVKKIGKFLVFNIVQILFYSKHSHIFGIKITRNSGVFHEITPLFYIPESIPTMVDYEQPCSEPWTGRFSHNTHHMSTYCFTLCRGLFITWNHMM